MNDIPIINNYIKNKKSQKKLDELFYKPTGPFNSKYKWSVPTEQGIKNEVTKLKEEITRLVSETTQYKKRNDEKTGKMQIPKGELKTINKQIYDLHRLKPLDYETELVKQQRADHNKEIYMNKIYFDKLDIILNMATFISENKSINIRIPHTLFPSSSPTQHTNMNVCQLFGDDIKAKNLCEEKKLYNYDKELSVPTTQSSTSYDTDVEYDTRCLPLSEENIPQHKLKYRTKTIDDVEFKIPENQALYNRQIKDYLNSNEYYLNRFSDSYI